MAKMPDLGGPAPANSSLALAQVFGLTHPILTLDAVDASLDQRGDAHDVSGGERRHLLDSGDAEAEQGSFVGGTDAPNPTEPHGIAGVRLALFGEPRFELADARAQRGAACSVGVDELAALLGFGAKCRSKLTGVALRADQPRPQHAPLAHRFAELDALCGELLSCAHQF